MKGFHGGFPQKNGSPPKSTLTFGTQSATKAPFAKCRLFRLLAGARMRKGMTLIQFIRLVVSFLGQTHPTPTCSASFLGPTPGSPLPKFFLPPSDRASGVSPRPRATPGRRTGTTCSPRPASSPGPRRRVLNSEVRWTFPSRLCRCVFLLFGWFSAVQSAGG